jgi:hypothetical protein
VSSPDLSRQAKLTSKVTFRILTYTGPDPDRAIGIGTAQVKPGSMLLTFQKQSFQGVTYSLTCQLQRSVLFIENRIRLFLLAPFGAPCEERKPPNAALKEPGLPG